MMENSDECVLQVFFMMLCLLKVRSGRRPGSLKGVCYITKIVNELDLTTSFAYRLMMY